MKPQKRINNSEEDINRLSTECGVSPLLADLLLQRGIDNKSSVNKFLYGSWNDLCDPYIYINMKEIVSVLSDCIRERKRIVIYGDYDCDGIGATAIFFLSLKKAGVPVYYYIPTRKDEGYGLNVGAIKKIKESFDPDVLLTVDCGIASHHEIEYAQSLCMTVLVTDHHTPTDKPLPCLYTDPCFTPERTQLCAAGVALYVVRALFGEEEAKKYIDICTISTIADIVPLTEDNRILVKEGLKKIRLGQTRIGIKTLIQYAKSSMRTLTTGDISFRIAPRLNAAGRLSTPIDALRLLIEDDPNTVLLLADNLSLQNSERQQLSSDIYKEAMEQLKGYDFGKYRLIMLYGNWNEGVVGIVCSKLTEFFHLPAILLCEQEDGTLCGSARSIEGVNLYSLLDSVKTNLLTYGGHSMAAGLSLLKTSFFTARDNMNARLRSMPSEIFVRRRFYDKEFSIGKIDYDTYRELNLLAPFGACNPAPVFYDEKPRLSFKKGSDRLPLIKAKTPVGEAVSFDGLRCLPFLTDDNYSLLYTVETNSFNGKESPQFSVKEIFIKEYTSEDEEVFYSDFTDENDYPTSTKSVEKPVLYICFLSRTISEVQKKYGADMPVYYMDTTKPFLSDGIVLCPTLSFPFYIYSKVVFCDYAHPIIMDKVKKIGCKTENYSHRKINNAISVDYLREVYVYYLKNLLPNPKAPSFGDFYQENSPGERIDFIAASCILKECGLLIRNENGEIEVQKKRSDPTQTVLYRYLQGEL